MKFFIHNYQIKFDTGKAKFIELSNSNFRIWVPKRLVYPKGDISAVYLPDNYQFKVYVGHSKVPIAENVGVESLAKGLKDLDLPDSIDGPVHHVPHRIEPIERRVEDEFKR